MIFIGWLLNGIYEAYDQERLIKKFLKDFEKKQFAEMLRKDQEDLEKNSKNIPAIMDTGFQWYNLMHWEYAVKWWEKGLNINPNNEIGWTNLGNAYKEMKNYKKAEEAYRYAMKISKPGETISCINLGELFKYSTLNKKDKEDDVYLECLKKHPNDRNLIAKLALYYRDIGNIKKAITYFNKLWDIEPTPEVSEQIRNLRILLNKKNMN